MMSMKSRMTATAPQLVGAAIALAAVVAPCCLAASAIAGEKPSKSKTAAVEAKPPTPLPEFKPEGTLATQYCQVVRDAALEARYVQQTETLEALRKDIADRLARLEARSAELKEWMARREEFKNKATGQLVGIFAAMRPEAAS